jgi:hypothetical protein
VWTAVVIGLHWRLPNYAMPFTVVVIAGLCAVLTATGAWVAMRGGDMARTWLTVLTTLMFLWGFLSIFSIGIGLLIGSSLTGHGGESPSGTQRTTGRVTIGSITYAYTCTDSHLTRFTTG